MRTRRKGSAGAPEPARDAGRELKPLRSLCGREKSGERRCRAGGGRCDAAAKHRLGAGECPCPGGRPVVGHLHTVEMRPRTVPGIVADPHLGHSRASAWYGQQGEHFVAVDHRRCIRMPFEPPCLTYNLPILQKRCATNGCVCQKLGKRHERERAWRHKVTPSTSNRIASSKRALATSVAPRRSSQKRRRSFCSSAFGRATSGVAVPRPYLKAME